MSHSIVIPAHNEAANLEAFVIAFLRKIPSRVELAEIILVENGSSDDTLVACGRLQREYPESVRVLSISRASYGEAIKTGIVNSRGTYVSILECDCLDPDFVVQCAELFESQHAAFVVASKRHRDSIDERPLKRRILTALYNKILLRMLLGYPGSDTHGLKGIEASIAKRLCELAITTDEVFQTELVLLAWRLGVKIHEVPIMIREARPAPVALLRRVPKVLDTIRQLKRSLRRFPVAGSEPGLHQVRATGLLGAAARIEPVSQLESGRSSAR